MACSDRADKAHEANSCKPTFGLAVPLVLCTCRQGWAVNQCSAVKLTNHKSKQCVHQSLYKCITLPCAVLSCFHAIYVQLSCDRVLSVERCSSQTVDRIFAIYGDTVDGATCFCTVWRRSISALMWQAGRVRWVEKWFALLAGELDVPHACHLGVSIPIYQCHMIRRAWFIVHIHTHTTRITKTVLLI